MTRSSPRSPKETVLAAWAAFGSRDPDQITAAFTPDAVWIAPVGNATATALGEASGRLDRDTIARFISTRLDRLFVSDMSVEVTKLIAEGQTVMIEQRFRATLVNGRAYDNAYCFVFEVEGEQVREMREYMDTLGGQTQVFGEAPPRKIA